MSTTFQSEIRSDARVTVDRAAASRRSLLQTVRDQIEQLEGLTGRLANPNMPAARDSAQVFQVCFRRLADQVQLEKPVATAVEQRALLQASDAFLALRADERELTSAVLLDLWSTWCAFEVRRLCQADLELVEWVDSLLYELEAYAAEAAASLRSIGAGVPELIGMQYPVSERVAERFAEVLYALAEGGPIDAAVAEERLADWASSLGGLVEAADYPEWHLLYNQAVEQVIADELEAPAGTALRALMTRLELSQDHAGRMLGVSGETVRRWERGATGIPAERRSAILAAEAGLRRLQDLFRPDRLATAIRRPADLFDGESALDWILRGRIAEVADRYEIALLYQA